MAWSDASQSTVVKCFINAGILNSEEETDEIEAACGKVDPFADLDCGISNVTALTLRRQCFYGPLLTVLTGFH